MCGHISYMYLSKSSRPPPRLEDAAGVELGLVQSVPAPPPGEKAQPEMHGFNVPMGRAHARLSFDMHGLVCVFVVCGSSFWLFCLGAGHMFSMPDFPKRSYNALRRHTPGEGTIRSPQGRT